jgi:serpin B
MHRRALLASAAAATALAACTSPPATDSHVTPPPETALAPGAFDVELYRMLATTAGNQFVSPYSVSSAFALVYPGARGETQREIAAVLGFDASAEAQSAQTRALSQALEAQSGGSEFTVANAAWVERTMELDAAYAEAVRVDLDGTIEAVDFIAAPQRAMRRINDWAEAETNGRITDLLTNPDPNRRLVLTNAVYFKGKWRNPFSAESTREGEFTTASGDTVPAQLMRQVTRARYFDTSAFQAAEFDYDEGAFALAVFLPREASGLAAFEGALTGEQLGAWLAQLGGAERARLDVTLPKIEVRSSYDLARTLQDMGMRLAFSGAADFSGITQQEALAISAVIHKTFLAIDEEGTEAAAATAIDMVATAAPMDPPPPPIEFKADHPHFIVLYHKPSGARLFLGRIATT